MRKFPYERSRNQGRTAGGGGGWSFLQRSAPTSSFLIFFPLETALALARSRCLARRERGRRVREPLFHKSINTHTYTKVRVCVGCSVELRLLSLPILATFAFQTVFFFSLSLSVCLCTQSANDSEADSATSLLRHRCRCFLEPRTSSAGRRCCCRP